MIHRPVTRGSKEPSGPRRPDPRPRGAADRSARRRSRLPRTPRRSRPSSSTSSARRAASLRSCAASAHCPPRIGPRSAPSPTPSARPSRPRLPSAATALRGSELEARLRRRGGRRHDARPTDPARHAPSEHRGDARDRRDLRAVRVRSLREPGDRGRPRPTSRCSTSRPTIRRATCGTRSTSTSRDDCCAPTRRPARSA